MLAENASVLERLAGLLPSRAPEPPPSNDVDRLRALGVPNVQDFRGIARSSKHKRGRPHGRRPVSQVGALGWHQTANGNLHEDHPLLLSVPAHSLVHRSGAITLLQDLTAYMWHGDAMNRFTIGIEIVARERGVIARASSFWLHPKERAKGLTEGDLAAPITNAQIVSALALGRWYADELARRGGKLIQCWAHRQAANKNGDPGERAWKHVVQPLVLELRLNNVEPLAIGGGKPIPREWGANTTLSYAA